MNEFDKIKLILKDNGINFLKADVLDKSKDIICTPYKGIKDSNNRIFIFMQYNINNKILSYYLVEQINPDLDIDKVKSKLLDMNSKNIGIFMTKDNNLIYEINLSLNENKFVFSNYMDNTLNCIETYEYLKEQQIIL